MPGQILAMVCLSFSFFPAQQAPGNSAGEKYHVSGVVVDEKTGQPIARATVHLGVPTDVEVGQTQRTGVDGRFDFGDVTAGRYNLNARRRGYLRGMYLQHEGFASAIVVGAGVDNEHLRFGMKEAATISGNVIDENGDAVRGAQVMLFRESTSDGKGSRRSGSQVSTDDEGHYEIHYLAQGTYFVAVYAQPWYAQYAQRQEFQIAGATGSFTKSTREPALDMVYPVTFFSNTGELSGAAALTLRPGDSERADFMMHPQPGLRIQVRVREGEQGEAAIGMMAQMMIGGSRHPVNANVVQVAPGVMEVSGLPPGLVELRADGRGEGNAWNVVQSVNLSGNATVDLTPARTIGTVSGSVRIENGAPLADRVMIQLHNRATGETLVAASGPDGKFSFLGQATVAGDYELSILQPEGFGVKSISATGSKATGRVIHVADGQEMELSVVATKRSAKIKGVVLRDDQPVVGAMVVLVPAGAQEDATEYRRDQSDSDGSFNLTFVSPGKYTVVALEKGWEMEWAKPGVLQKYLAGGEIVQVGADEKTEVKVKVKVQ